MCKRSPGPKTVRMPIWEFTKPGNIDDNDAGGM